MKTGILTFHDTTNFGSMLQTYGLYKALKDLEIDCEIIDYQCDEIIKREVPYQYMKFHSIKNILGFVLYGRRNHKKHIELNNFLKEHMIISNKQYNKTSIVNANNEYNAFIVGSDIVWGLDITNNDLTYFLDFVMSNKLKISYASSIGKKYTNEEKMVVAPFIRQFDLISVREEQAKIDLQELVENLTINLVCDPTMLVKEKYWVDLALTSSLQKKLEQEKYILMYFPDSERRMLKDALCLKKKYGYKIIYINDRKPILGVKNVFVDKVEDFLCYIFNASIVLSGSYHGTLFSVYFRKKFFYYVRSHKERMITLSSQLDISNRMSENISMQSVNIDYEMVTCKVEELRKKSYDYLKQIVKLIKGETEN